MFNSKIIMKSVEELTIAVQNVQKKLTEICNEIDKIKDKINKKEEISVNDEEMVDKSREILAQYMQEDSDLIKKYFGNNE